jgi:GNAT superfamily N-acetyltransferase
MDRSRFAAMTFAAAAALAAAAAAPALNSAASQFFVQDAHPLGGRARPGERRRRRGERPRSSPERGGEPRLGAAVPLLRAALKLTGRASGRRAPHQPDHRAVAAEPSPVKRLTVADLAAVVELQTAVTSGLPAGFIWPRTEQTLRGYLDGTLGAAYGIAEGDALVAVSLLRVQDSGHPLVGPRFRLVPEADWSRHACFLENTMVVPAARGRGYQRALIGTRLAHAASAGMRWACAGIALENSVSWANLLAEGMVIADIRCDLGYPIIGLLRAFNAPELKFDPDDRVLVGGRDHVQHQAALQAGYIGVSLTPDGAVVYQRLSPRVGP